MKLIRSRKALVVVLLGLVAGVLVIRDMRDDAGISRVEDLEIRGSRILGARVKMQDPEVDWQDGKIAVPGLTVANPTGFSGRNMISIESINMQADFKARVIEEVKIDGVKVAIEFQGERSNIESAGERVVESGERDEEVEEKDSDEEESSDDGKSNGDNARDDWLVERVEFDEAGVSVQADWTEETRQFEIAGFAVEGLNGETDDLVRAVVIEFLDKVVSSAAEEVEDDRLRQQLLDRVGALREKVADQDDDNTGKE